MNKYKTLSIIFYITFTLVKSVFFIAQVFIPASNPLGTEAHINISVCIPETPLNHPTRWNFLNHAIKVSFNMCSASWCRISSQFSLLTRVKQGIVRINIETTCCTTPLMDQIHVQDQEVLFPFRKDVPLQFALNAIREYRQFQKPRRLDQDLLGSFVFWTQRRITLSLQIFASA